MSSLFRLSDFANHILMSPFLWQPTKIPTCRTRVSYGHTMIIDPWGRILGELDGSEEGLLIRDLDLSVLDTTRAQMPVLSHARTDLYGNPADVSVTIVSS
jgi:predicted amidohydrolase